MREEHSSYSIDRTEPDSRVSGADEERVSKTMEAEYTMCKGGRHQYYSSSFRSYSMYFLCGVFLAVAMAPSLCQAQTGFELWNTERPPSMPQIEDLEVMCGKTYMRVRVKFTRAFQGLVFSKGQYGNSDCVYVRPNSGRKDFTFDVDYKACGTKPDLNGRFYENTIVVQYDSDLIEAWDEAKRLRCEWFSDYEKTASKPPMIISDLEVIELNFQGDNVDCWMEIQEGKGPWAKPVSGIVPLGNTMTMVIGINDNSGEFDMRVKSCQASGSRGPVIHISDAIGCVQRPKMFSQFMKIKTNDGHSTVITYAHFHAFKFPDSMTVHLRCKVEICRYGCPNHCEAGYSRSSGGEALANSAEEAATRLVEVSAAVQQGGPSYASSTTRQTPVYDKTPVYELGGSTPINIRHHGAHNENRRVSADASTPVPQFVAPPKLPTAAASPLRQGPPRPSAYRSPPRSSSSINNLDADIDLEYEEEPEDILGAGRNAGGGPVGDREFAALFADGEEPSVPLNLVDKEKAQVGPVALKKEFLRQNPHKHQGQHAHRPDSIPQETQSIESALPGLNEGPRYLHSEHHQEAASAGVAQVIAVPLPFGAPPSGPVPQPVRPPSDKMVPPPPPQAQQKAGSPHNKRPQHVPKVPVHRDVPNESPLVFGDTPIHPPPREGAAAPTADDNAATFISERQDTKDNRKRFPWGPRSMDFDDFRSSESSGASNKGDNAEYLGRKPDAGAASAEYRQRRSVSLDKADSGTDVGVTTSFDVISGADLNFVPDASDTNNVAVFSGRIREEVVYGICLPAPGFSALFVLLALCTVIAVLTAGFMCYHRQQQKDAANRHNDRFAALSAAFTASPQHPQESPFREWGGGVVHFFRSRPMFSHPVPPHPAS